MSVPSIIHYCWFGKKPIPAKLQQCIASWRQVMPDWSLQCWNEETFDVNTIPWTKEAYAAKKFAFVSDYVRLVALYEFGGVYLDTDVKLLKSLEPLLKKHAAFTGFENGTRLTSAVIAAPPRHPLIKQFLEYYRDKHFLKEVVSNNEANVIMMTDICKQYGLCDDGSEQDLEIVGVSEGEYSSCKFHIFPQTYFCPLDFWHNKNFTENTYAIHYFDASWLDDETKNRIKKERTLIYKIKIAAIRLMVKLYHLFRK